MDFAPAFQPVIQVLWYIIPLIILANVLKSPWFKGWMGECLVNVFARLFLDKNTYHLIRNVTLPTEDGTTQIDHIIVSPFGVFVVETKNMKGWIFGSAHQRHWTQKIFKHSQKFQNPLHQNYKHVKTLQALLGLSDSQIHSVVVFVGDATLKTEMPGNVTKGLGFLRFIKSHSSAVLTTAQVKTLVENIARGRLKPNWRTHRDHVKHVQGIVEGKQAELGLIAERDEYNYGRSRQRRDGWMVKPLFAAGILAVTAFYWMGVGKPENHQSAQSIQIAQAKVPEQQLALDRQQQARQEALRVKREHEERRRLAALRNAREREFERAFLESYVEPEGCDNWQSDRHMVECINHRMRAKAGFRVDSAAAGG